MTSTCEPTRKWTLAELASFVGGDGQGNLDKTVSRVAKLGDATRESISYCSSPAQARRLNNTQAGIVILSEQFQQYYDGDCIITEQPRLAFSQVVDLLHPPDGFQTGIHETAVIGTDCTIDSSACIGPNAVVGNRVQIAAKAYIDAGTVVQDQVSIGSESRIGANATIYRRTRIGRNCRFSAGVVLGASGFSFEWDGSRWMPLRNIGDLVIGDDVDVGACTSIDRASVGETRIDDGVRIDNNCHLGHNVVIGENTLVVANVSIGGSTSIGHRCVIGGHVAIRDNIEIADDVTILGASVITKSITEAGTYSSAVPARAAKKWNRALAQLHRMAN